MMAEGGWIVLGSALGTAGSILTTWLHAWLNREKPDYFDRKAMKLLKNILEGDPKKWHKIQLLANVVGLSVHETKQLLLLIDARADHTNSEQWGLISAHPIKEIE
jgi:hypothetical protein